MKNGLPNRFMLSFDKWVWRVWSPPSPRGSAETRKCCIKKPNALRADAIFELEKRLRSWLCPEALLWELAYSAPPDIINGELLHDLRMESKHSLEKSGYGYNCCIDRCRYSASVSTRSSFIHGSRDVTRLGLGGLSPPPNDAAAPQTQTKFNEESVCCCCGHGRL